MGDQGQLLQLEEQFWKGDAEFYRAMLTDDARLVFADPVGTMGREAAVESIRAAPRWQSVEFTEVDQVALSPDAVLLTYRVAARRSDQDAPYRARASSVYVDRDGRWLLAFHQQTSSQA